MRLWAKALLLGFSAESSPQALAEEMRGWTRAVSWSGCAPDRYGHPGKPTPGFRLSFLVWGCGGSWSCSCGYSTTATFPWLSRFLIGTEKCAVQSGHPFWASVPNTATVFRIAEVADQLGPAASTQSAPPKRRGPVGLCERGFESSPVPP